MVKAVVASVSTPMYTLACVPSRGVWGFLDLLRLLLTQSGTKFHYSIAIYY